MKYIKRFENLGNEPKVGDWVIVNTDFGHDNLDKYLHVTPGKLIIISDNPDLPWPYGIEYDINKMPMYIYEEFVMVTDNTYISVGLDEIEYWAPNKEDLEIILKTKKYNL